MMIDDSSQLPRHATDSRPPSGETPAVRVADMVVCHNPGAERMTYSPGSRQGMAHYDQTGKVIIKPPGANLYFP